MRYAAFLLMTVSAMAEYATVDGHRVYYEVAGRGEPSVVLIHGWTCDGTFWRAQRDALSKRYSVITVDLPGHGRSDKPEIRYDLPLFSRAVQATMDAARRRRAVLVGHSMGAAVIRQVYADKPDRVIALVSVDGATFRNPSAELKKQLADWSETMRGPAGLEVRRKFVEGMFTSATTPELRKQIATTMLAAPEHVAVSALSNMFASSLWIDPPPVRVPVLAINKVSKDGRMKQTHEQSYANLEYHELDNVSHFLQMEAPDRFNTILLAFLDKAGR